ncbi:ZN574 protein, partial [Bucco capensis]|nr:ZN574 protein [Bucco capensis]
QQQQEEETLVLVEHRYVCSECSHLCSSLEDALLHQQQHLGPPQQHQYELVGLTGDYQTLAVPESSQYQCLECGQLLVSPGQLLEHQEMHIKLLGQEPEPSAATKVLLGTPGGVPGGIHYECVECKALFASQEVWLSHRQSHRAEVTSSCSAVTNVGTTASNQGQGQNQALVDLEHSYRKPEEEEEQEKNGMSTESGGGSSSSSSSSTVQLLLYECGECLQLFQNPKEFLEHQAAHLASPALNGEAQSSAEHSYKLKEEEMPPPPPPPPPP